MTRYRWFQTEWPFSIPTLAQRLKSKPFGDEVMDGFVLDRVRDEYLEARYIEKLEYTQEITDPYGKELSFPRIDFKLWEFRASSNFPGLELMNSPRSTQTFISRLLEASDFSLAVNPLEVDVLNWASLFQSVTNIKVVVDSLQIGALELDRGIFAKTVIKGEKDVLDASTSITKGRRYNLEKVQLRLQGEHKGTIILTNSGSANMNVSDKETLVKALRQSLAQIIRST
jgi:hypothetical protein